ncbi:MAG: hypothetical protein J5784_02710 [Muribaculaceae bacterium]|nr:hypothetical protein [Muribaculaceae bacterium]
MLHPEGYGGPKAFLPPRRFSDCKINSFFYYRQHFGDFFENVPFFANMQAIKSPTALGHRAFFTSILPCYRLKIILLRQKRQEKTARLTFLMVAFFLG